MRPAPDARALAERRARHEPYRAEAAAAASGAGQALRVAAPGDYNRGVVGEQFHQDHLEAVAGGYRREDRSIIKPGVLEHEDDNVHDANAVRVMIEGGRVGYLAAKDALRFRQALAKAGHAGAPVAVAAKIRGGLRWTSTSKIQEPFRVRLDLTWPLKLD